MPTSRRELSDQRIFLFGNRGYMSAILPALLERHATIIGLCTRPPKRPASALRRAVRSVVRRSGLRRADDFLYRDPFEALPEPRTIAEQHGIRVLSSSTLRDRDFAKELSELAPDVILVAGFHRLIPSEVFTLARQAAVNLHPSLLPHHRGGTPNRWAVRHGEQRTGITAHLLSDEFDKGDIISQVAVEIGADDTWGEVEERLLGRMPGFAIDVLRLVASGDAAPMPQTNICAEIEPSYNKHHQVIDWSLSLEDIRRTCLAIRPKSGGLAVVRNEYVCVWDVGRTYRKTASPVPPGTIVAFDDQQRPVVACGDGILQISQILRFGRIIPARSLVRELHLRVGDRFTDHSA